MRHLDYTDRLSVTLTAHMYDIAITVGGGGGKDNLWFTLTVCYTPSE
jgi:hypothetical protein